MKSKDKQVHILKHPALACTGSDLNLTLGYLHLVLTLVVLMS